MNEIDKKTLAQFHETLNSVFSEKLNEVITNAPVLVKIIKDNSEDYEKLLVGFESEINDKPEITADDFVRLTVINFTRGLLYSVADDDFFGL